MQAAGGRRRVAGGQQRLRVANSGLRVAIAGYRFMRGCPLGIPSFFLLQNEPLRLTVCYPESLQLDLTLRNPCYSVSAPRNPRYSGFAPRRIPRRPGSRVAAIFRLGCRPESPQLGFRAGESPRFGFRAAPLASMSRIPSCGDLRPKPPPKIPAARVPRRGIPDSRVSPLRCVFRVSRGFVSLVASCGDARGNASDSCGRALGDKAPLRFNMRSRGRQ